MGNCGSRIIGFGVFLIIVVAIFDTFEIIPNTVEGAKISIDKYGIVFIILIIIYAVYKIFFYFTHRKPLSYEEAKKLSKLNAKTYVSLKYKFSKQEVKVNQYFKSQLNAKGAWYEIEEPLKSFPMYVATLLEGKHHEWVVVAIERNGLVTNMWVNKGMDNQSVSLACDFMEIIKKCKQVGGYSILRFHNHPNYAPDKLTTLVASKQDYDDSKKCASIVCKEGINWFDFICSRGQYKQFFSKISDMFEVDGGSTSDIIDRIGITPEMDYKLQREYHGKKRIILTEWIVIILVVLFLISPFYFYHVGKNNRKNSNTTNKNDYSTQGISERPDVTNDTIEDETVEISGRKSTSGLSVEVTSTKMVSQDGITYNYDDSLNGFVVVSADSQETVRIPDTIHGTPVVAIGEKAFYKHEELKHINLPDSIIEIRNEAFGWCTSLEDFIYPSKVTTVSQSSFWNCSSLTKVTFNDSIITIENNAFYNCSFESIELPASLIAIEAYAFEQCRALKNIKIPERVESIGKKAFILCEGLQNISLPESMISIGGGCFRGCTNLQNIVIPPNVSFLDWEVFVYCDSLQTVKVPRSCKISAPAGKFTMCDAEIIIY